MATYLHPKPLGEFQRYRQASRILRETSRASNPGWYASALEIELQLHLRVDGGRVDSWLYHRARGEWNPGPAVNENIVLDPEETAQFASALVALARMEKTPALGVVLHLAEEFATAELKRDLDPSGNLAELRERIVEAPAAVLDDSSFAAEEYSFRLLPYAAQEGEAIATAVTVSRRWAPFLQALRQAGEAANFPVITRALSAPLCALLALPEFKREAASRPLLALLPYRRFTILAFFNERAELLLLRTLQHRGQRGPANFRHALTTAVAALELAGPEVHLLPTLTDPDPRLLADLETVDPDFRSHALSGAVPTGRVELFRHDSAGFAQPAAELPLEMRIVTQAPAEAELPLASASTFAVLRDEGWALQDFLPVPGEMLEVYPSRGEMKMLRSLRYLRFALVLLTLLAFGWFAYTMAAMIHQPEWAFREEDGRMLRQRQVMLTAQKTRIEHWDNLLEDRAKAWAGMELLALLAPENGGILVKSFDHSALPIPVPGQAKIGFIKEWKVSGMARESAVERLSMLNTREGISALFNELAKSTGNEAFRTDLPTRSIVVNIRTQENSGYRPGPDEEQRISDESSYPFAYDLTISQRFESTDPMAINSNKAP